MSALRLGARLDGVSRPGVRRLAPFVALAVAGVAVVAAAGVSWVASQGAVAQTPVAIVKATRDIAAGSVITDDELGITTISSRDASTLDAFVRSEDKGRLVGRTASVGITAGAPVPASTLLSDAHASLWDTDLAIKRMPADLRQGDHVAVIVVTPQKTGEPIDVVSMQDVEVAAVQQGAADLWLPPKFVSQMQWYADHGGIVLVKMTAGAIQQDLSGGGPPKG